MTKIILSSIFIITLFMVNSAFSAPTLFNNVMAFDDHNFGLIDFDGSQDSYASIDVYLSDYNAGLAGGSFGDGQIVASYSWGHGVPTSNFLVGDNAYVRIDFNTPIHAVGLFLTWANRSSSSLTVTLTDNSTYSYHYSDANLPSASYDINGFMGLTSDIGIKYFEYDFGSDKMAIDAIYFADAVNLYGLPEGPKDIPNEDADTIPLPTFIEGSGSSTIPEPVSMILMSLGVLGILARKIIGRK